MNQFLYFSIMYSKIIKFWTLSTRSRPEDGAAVDLTLITVKIRIFVGTTRIDVRFLTFDSQKNTPYYTRTIIFKLRGNGRKSQ